MDETKNHPSIYVTSVLFLFSFLTASTYVFVRALAVTLFIARAGTDNLPLVLTISALVVIVLSIFTRYAVERLKTKLTVSVTWTLLAALTIGIGVLLKSYHHSLIALGSIYVFAEIRGCLNTIYVVTFSNEQFENSESKSPYAIVASGAPFAGILVGGILGFEASLVSLIPAITIIVILDLATAITSLLLPTTKVNGRPKVKRQRQLRFIFDKRTRENEASPGKYRTGSYRWNLAFLMSLKIVVLTLIGYQWKVSVGNFFGTNETQLLAYFASFYAASDVIIVSLQWLVAGKLMDRWGIGIGLMGFPIAVSLVAVGVFFVDSSLALMLVFTLGKGLNVLRRSIHDPGLTVAYTVIDPRVRRETIVFVKGMVKPFAEAFSAAWLLFVGGILLEDWITGIWFLLTLPWLYFAFKVATSFYKKDQLMAVAVGSSAGR